MTDKDDAGRSSKPKPHRYPDADAVLSTLVALTDSVASCSFALTVHTPSGAVIGTAVNAQEWMRLMQRDLNARTGAAVVGVRVLVSVFEGAIEMLAEEANGQDLVAPDYVHFKDARVVMGDGALPAWDMPGSLLRVPIKDVSGWAMTSYSRTTRPGPPRRPS